MPTVSFQVNRRIKNTFIKNSINASVVLFMLLMVIGRTIAGVHWLTDIVGSVLLSVGLFWTYKGIVLMKDCKER
jgi:undecaprenyl-diphosphatase